MAAMPRRPRLRTARIIAAHADSIDIASRPAINSTKCVLMNAAVATSAYE